MNESRDYQAINQALIKVYSGIMWIEEHELRKSTFADLTIKEMHAIDAISMYDHQTASAVAKKLHLTPGTMTATADRLTKKGYVKRVRDEQDRRIVRLYLTKKGRVLYRTHRFGQTIFCSRYWCNLSTRGPGWTHRWCTSCSARSIAG